jgi:integrase
MDPWEANGKLWLLAIRFRLTSERSMQLTQSTTATIGLLPGQHDRIVFDERLPGFGLRLRAGKRTWIVQYRLGRKQRRQTIGPADRMLAGQAFVAAQQVLEEVALGRDPSGATRRKHLEVSFGSARQRFLATKQPHLKSASFEALKLHLTSHWSGLCDLSMRGINVQDIEQHLDQLAVTRGPYAANRARASLASFFRWALEQGLIDTNPVLHTRAAVEKARHRVLNDSEIVALWRSCQHDDYGAIVRLLLLTGQRRQHVGAMQVTDVDFREHKWGIADGAAGPVHEIPLCDFALSIIKEVSQRRDREQGALFGRRLRSGFSGWSKAKRDLDCRIEAATGAEPYWAVKDPSEASSSGHAVEMEFIKPGAWRLNDLRRTVEVRLGELGIAPHIVDAILNHTYKGVRQSRRPYDYSVEKRQALDLWAKHIFALLAGDVAHLKA